MQRHTLTLTHSQTNKQNIYYHFVLVYLLRFLLLMLFCVPCTTSRMGFYIGWLAVRFGLVTHCHFLRHFFPNFVLGIRNLLLPLCGLQWADEWISWWWWCERLMSLIFSIKIDAHIFRMQIECVTNGNRFSCVCFFTSSHPPFADLFCVCLFDLIVVAIAIDVIIIIVCSFGVVLINTLFVLMLNRESRHPLTKRFSCWNNSTVLTFVRQFWRLMAFASHFRRLTIIIWMVQVAATTTLWSQVLVKDAVCSLRFVYPRNAALPTVAFP